VPGNTIKTLVLSDSFLVSDKTKFLGAQSFVGLFCRFVVSDKTKSWVRRCVSTFRRETDLQGPETSLPLQALRASLALQGPKETFGDPHKFTRNTIASL